MDGSSSCPVRRCTRLLLALSVLILALNAVLHDPRVGYDAAAHRAYAGVLAHGRLPSPAESSEFFSAPLSYVPAAALLALRLPEPIVAKLWQLLQVGYAAVLLIYLRRIARALKMTAWGELAALLTLLGAAVWWRSFALLRPEALLASVVVVAAYHTIRLFQGERAIGHFVTAGVLWGLACLSRQWGILAVLGVVAAAGIAPKPDRRWWRGVAISAACCAVVAGPFYAYLHLRFGSVTAFNQSTAPARLNWGWNPIAAARSPFTPGLRGRPLDILYADTYGDYWMYFLARGVGANGRSVSGSHLVDALADGTTLKSSNVHRMARYLRVSLLGSIPAGVVIVWAALAGCVVAVVGGVRRRDGVPGAAVLVGILVSTLLGYAWFVMRYTAPAGDTDTVKASYLLQAWPILCLFTGAWVDRLRRRFPRGAMAVIVLLAATVLINAGTMVTRFIAFH